MSAALDFMMKFSIAAATFAALALVTWHPLCEALTVMSVDFGAEFMKIAVVAVSVTSFMQMLRTLGDYAHPTFYCYFRILLAILYSYMWT